MSLFVSFPYQKCFLSLRNRLIDWINCTYRGYQEFDKYLTLVMINNMAEKRCEFKIVVSVKPKSEIWQHCEFVKVKDEVSKTKIACRHCQIELKYSGNISNFSYNLTRKHSAVFLPAFSPFPTINSRAVNRNYQRYYARSLMKG